MDLHAAPAPDTDPDLLPAGSVPLFIGLQTACERAAQRHPLLGRMLEPQQPVLRQLESRAPGNEQALALCGRLLGLVLDAIHGADLHALIRLRRGLRLAAAFLQLQAQGPVELVARRRADDPDLRAQLGGVWAAIDLRPRRGQPGGHPRYRLRSAGTKLSLQRIG